MALSALHVWIANEILFASDLNAEFANLYTSGEDLSTPATKIHDMNGFEITMDADGDSALLADTDDRLDIKLSGVRLFRFDGTVATPVNGLDFVGSATGVDVVIRPQGSDANIDLDIQAKGTGSVLIQGSPVALIAESFSL